MDAVTPGGYSLRRLGWIAVTAGILSVSAFALGFTQAGFGGLAATPVAMFNAYLIFAAVQRPASSNREIQVCIAKRTVLRMGLSIVVLLISLQFGVEFLIGALLGIVSEMWTYMGDAIRLMFTRGG